MKKIALTQGYFATVDDEDYERISRFKWCVLRKKNEINIYAKRLSHKKEGGKKRTILMHRFILGTPSNELVVDHINGNGLDNRRKNLRIVTGHINNLNRRGPTKNNRSGYRGVIKTPSNRWQARGKHEGKNVNLGFFDKLEEAAKVAKEYREIQLKSALEALAKNKTKP